MHRRQSWWYRDDNDRSWQKPDTAYQTPPDPTTGAQSLWFTSDGEGRIYYDSITELIENVGEDIPLYELDPEGPKHTVEVGTVGDYAS